MIGTNEVQAAIISQLKANAPLTDIVGEEIREEQWMSPDYTYPCVRVHITRVAPIGVPGSCERTSFTAEFSITYRANAPSSRSTSTGMQTAIEAMHGEALVSAEWSSRTPAILTDVIGPIPEGIDVWMSRAFFTARLQELPL